MFTSRSEYRLSLRVDNADERLTGRGIEIGCVGRERREAFRKSQAELHRIRAHLESLTLTPQGAAKRRIPLNRDGVRRTAFQLLSYPEIKWGDLRGSGRI